MLAYVSESRFDGELLIYIYLFSKDADVIIKIVSQLKNTVFD